MCMYVLFVLQKSSNIQIHFVGSCWYSCWFLDGVSKQSVNCPSRAAPSIPAEFWAVPAEVQYSAVHCAWSCTHGF